MGYWSRTTVKHVVQYPKKKGKQQKNKLVTASLLGLLSANSDGFFYFINWIWLSEAYFPVAFAAFLFSDKWGLASQRRTLEEWHNVSTLTFLALGLDWDGSQGCVLKTQSTYTYSKWHNISM